MVARKKNTGFETEQGKPIPLGVNRVNGDMNFAAAVPNVKECRLNLYHRITGDLADSILLTDKHRTGNVFSVLIKDFNPQDYSYMYHTEKKEFIDPYARIIYGKEDYGKRLTAEEKSLVRGGFLSGEYNWQDQRNTPLLYSELIVYKMNIRGFTKHSSSKVQNKGTFLGLLEKLPYLVELGINCIQLMPIYEFNEIIEYSGFGSSYKLNYWGYSPDNSYFAPKAAYASNPGQADLELKDMVNTLHQNGIEVIMEMNFANNENPVLIQDCLRYWAMEYHIDGFKINCDTVSASLLALDPILGRTKLLAAGWNCNQLYEKDYEPIYKNLAEYNDGYSVDVKRFLKADEDMVGPFAFRLRQNSNKYSMVNYITNHDGFTLMDLYSYDRKHNEANGENNHDGASYNYSWNCGEEGKTKKKKVLELRKKQIKNAFSALLFSQGTPLILAGDEFGNILTRIAAKERS
jgi:glycogen operon protein